MRRVNAKPPAVFSHLHSIASRAASQMESPPKLSRGGLSPASIFLLSVVIAALFLYLLATFVPGRSDQRFEIIIDGGSTGTRIHVFAYAIGPGGDPQLDLAASSTLKENPGLSAYAEDPVTAGESLFPLLEFAREKVPKSLWKETKIRLMATAGMRLLDRKIQERILLSCRRVLEASGFLFFSEWASVISGIDEGIYAWVSANYALGSLGGNPGDTTGIIELGGASAQITFVSREDIPSEFKHVLQFGKVSYNLYSHSFLHFGQNSAHESFLEFLSSRGMRSDEDPCSPKGFSSAGNLQRALVSKSSNFSACRSAVRMLLQREKGECVYEECRLGSAFVPALEGKFIATENFFFTSKFFGLGRRAVLSDFIAAGEKFCRDDWKREKRHSVDEDDLVHYCFSSAYIVALLHDGLGLPLNDQRIIYANDVGEVPLDWAMGAFLMLAAPERGVDLGNSKEFSGERSQSGSTLGVLAAGLAVVVVVGWWASRRKAQAQVKTVYDLERGRYIVTRVAAIRWSISPIIFVAAQLIENRCSVGALVRLMDGSLHAIGTRSGYIVCPSQIQQKKHQVPIINHVVPVNKV